MDPQYGNPPRYTMLNNNMGGVHPPPSRRNIPRYNSEKKKGGCGICGCLCCCSCCLLLFILSIIGSFAYFYILLSPMVPKYSVKDLEVSSFEIRPDYSLHSEISIVIQATNPNKNIGIFYGQDSMVLVLYKDAIISSGKLPSFYQDHQNTTILKVVLKGDNVFGSGLYQAFEESERFGMIPLEIFVKVPVVLRAWSTNTSEVKVLVNCHLVVDSFKPNKKVSITSSNYEVNLEM